MTDYMRQYMQQRRARFHAQGLTSAGRTPRPRARYVTTPGFCSLCGHVSPDPACPVCVSELERHTVTLAAWQQLEEFV